jgi:hypothetical protein
VTAQTPGLLWTFNNPTPATADYFGSALAALGNDRILVGAPNDDTTAIDAGAVYLFRTNGTLLTTFTNPAPAQQFGFGHQFGSAVATLGSDRVVIGSGSSGRVYLFATNGALVQAMSPTNFDGFSFGAAVAAYGSDRVLIGAPNSNFDPDLYYDYGAAYLLSSNGTLLTTFTNPDPGTVNEFGFSVAAFGSDRVLIGVNDYRPGAAYLYNTNGTLLMTFTNPAPENIAEFGHAVAAAGTDRILVGAYGDETMDAGSVYVFNTNGILLTTITNPTPAAGDCFGARIAMLGTDRVVVNASHDNTTGPEAGSAYVFNLDGTLVATLNNPAPASGDLFGFRVAAFGSEGVIIGATWDDAGATNAGSVYLFSVPSAPPPPALAIQRTTTNTVVVSWPSTATGFVLQQSTNGIGTVNWSNIMGGVQDNGTMNYLIVNPPTGDRFYRLLKQ